MRPLLPALTFAVAALFYGRVLIHSETPEEMASGPCQRAWDSPGAYKVACSHVFPDPLHPGQFGCWIEYQQPGGEWAIQDEIRNCATVDQDIYKKEHPN